MLRANSASTSPDTPSPEFERYVAARQAYSAAVSAASPFAFGTPELDVAEERVSIASDVHDEAAAAVLNRRYKSLADVIEGAIVVERDDLDGSLARVFVAAVLAMPRP